MAGSEIAQRVLVALVAVPIAVGAMFLGGWVLAALLALLAALAAIELFRMVAGKGIRAFQALGAGGAAAFVLLAAVAPQRGAEGAGFWSLLVLLMLGAVTAAIWVRGVAGQPLLAVSATVFGALYTGGLLAHGVFLRHLPLVVTPWQGTALVFAPVLLTWASDTFAYFVGRRYGRRKLIPKVSPGKTVEGAAGAVAGTILVALLYAQVLDALRVYPMSVAEALIFGVLMSVAAQLGDLAESLLKRDAGVKDSGALFPGHGGALDRLDSLLFTLPVAYAFFRILGPL